MNIIGVNFLFVGTTDVPVPKWSLLRDGITTDKDNKCLIKLWLVESVWWSALLLHTGDSWP